MDFLKTIAESQNNNDRTKVVMSKVINYKFKIIFYIGKRNYTYNK